MSRAAGHPTEFPSCLKYSQDLMTTCCNVLAKRKNHILHFQDSLCSVICESLCVGLPRAVSLKHAMAAEHAQMKVGKGRTPLLAV